MNSSRDDIDIAALWNGIKRRWALLLGLPLLAGIAAYSIANSLNPLYTSEARLLIDSEETVYTRPAVEERRFEPIGVNKAVVATQVEVLTSRDLANKVIGRLKLAEKPEFNRSLDRDDWQTRLKAWAGLNKNARAENVENSVSDEFSERLSVYPVQGTHVIKINFSSEDSQLAATVANMVADEYVAWQREAKLRVNKGASKWLSAEITALREKVKRAEERAETFRAKTGQNAAKGAVNLNDQQLSELNTQLIRAKAQRNEIEARVELIDEMLESRGGINAAPDILKSPLIQNLLEQQATIQRMRAELSATLLSGHPRLKQLNSELLGLRRQIRTEMNKVAASLKNEGRIARVREKSLLDSMEALKNSSAAASADTIKLRALQREAKANRDLLESYLARYRDASSRRDSDSVPANATVVSKAYASSVPSFPRKGPIAALTSGAVFLLAFSYVVSGLLLGGTGGSAARAEATSRGAPDGALTGSDNFSEQSAAQNAGRARFEKDRRKVAEQLGLDSSGTKDTAGLSKPPVICREIGDVVDYLSLCSDGDLGFRILFAGTDDNVDASADLVVLGRLLTQKQLDVAILDVTEGASSVCGQLGIARVPGLYELAKGTSTIGDALNVHEATSLKVISSGNPQLDCSREEMVRVLEWALKGLDLKNAFIFLHAEYHQVKDIFHKIDGGVDAVVFVTHEGEARAFAEDQQSYLLGTAASNLDVLYLERSSKSLGLTTSDVSRAVPA